MRLYFPAANGLHPVPEDCQENPRITTVGGGALCGFCGSCLRTGLNLAARLSAGRIRYGLISLETTSSHWSTHKAADFLNFPPVAFFFRHPSRLSPDIMPDLCKLLPATLYLFYCFPTQRLRIKEGRARCNELSD